MKTLIRSADGDSLVWWSWQDLRGDWANPQGRKVKPKGFCAHGRARLHVPNNCVHVEWDFGRLNCALSLEFSNRSFSDDAILFHIAIPFIVNFFVGVERADWVKQLPGIGPGWEDGDREIGMAVHDWTFWLYPWRNRDGRPWSFHVLDFLLGRDQYSETQIESGAMQISMAEGKYPATYRLFRSTWKRPRWPWPTHLLRGDMEVEHGIPVPGKGENSWDQEDTAIYSLTCPATTREELAEKFVATVLRKRTQYGWRDEAAVAQPAQES